MKRFYFLIIFLLLLAATPVRPQDKVMQIYSGGEVVYEVPAAQVDSVTFKAEEELPSIITPILLAKGTLMDDDYFIDIPQYQHSLNLIITTSEEWNKLIADTHLSDVERDVDFLMYQVIVLINAVLPSTGAIDITSIKEYADKIIVIFENRIGVFPMVTQPYHIVKIPVSDKEIVFEYNNSLTP